LREQDEQRRKQDEELLASQLECDTYKE